MAFPGNEAPAWRFLAKAPPEFSERQDGADNVLVRRYCDGPAGRASHRDIRRFDVSIFNVPSSFFRTVTVISCPRSRLEAFVTKRRDRRAAHKFLKRTMKRYGRPSSIVTDRLPSYRAAMKALGNPGRQDCGRWLNNRAENSHLPFRRREGAMARLRDIKTLQKFSAVHASFYNHFNHQRNLNRRQIFKQHRATALAEWRELGA